VLFLPGRLDSGWSASWHLLLTGIKNGTGKAVRKHEQFVVVNGEPGRKET
jgi:hypothetical protein